MNLRARIIECLETWGAMTLDQLFHEILYSEIIHFPDLEFAFLELAEEGLVRLSIDLTL